MFKTNINKQTTKLTEQTNNEKAKKLISL